MEFFAFFALLVIIGAAFAVAAPNPNRTPCKKGGITKTAEKPGKHAGKTAGHITKGLGCHKKGGITRGIEKAGKNVGKR